MDGLFSNLRNYIVCLFVLLENGRLLSEIISKGTKETRKSRLACYSYLKDEKRLIGIILITQG